MSKNSGMLLCNCKYEPGLLVTSLPVNPNVHQPLKSFFLTDIHFLDNQAGDLFIHSCIYCLNAVASFASSSIKFS